VKCAPFDYVRAVRVEEAVKVLTEADGNGKILAGGQSLVPVLALRMAHPSVLVDVNRIADPATIRTVDDGVEIGALTTSLAEDEMITAVRFPLPSRWGFAEFARRHGDFALVSAVVAEVDGEVRIALGGVASVPQRVRAAEQVIADGGAARQAAAAAAAEIDPTADLHGSAPFRRAIAAEMVRRALAQAGIGEERP